MSHPPRSLPLISLSPQAGPARRQPGAVKELPDDLSARTLLSRGQAVTGAVVLAVIAAAVLVPLATGLGPPPRDTAVAAIAVVTAAYVCVIAFRMALVVSAQWASVLWFSPEELEQASLESLPVYSVLVPLYRE